MRIVTSAMDAAFRHLVIAIAIGLSMQATMLHAVDVFVTSEADSGAGTLREAIGNVNSGDVVVFNIAVAAPVINLATPLPSLSGDISFRNDGGATVVIDRNGTAAWEFSGGTIDPTGLNFADGGVPSVDADIITTADTTLIGNAIVTANLTSPGTISPGTISPGTTAAAGNVGTWEVTGDLDASNSTIAIDIDSAGATQADLVSVGGTATLTDSVLSPTFVGESFTIGQSFTIFEAGSIVGAFANAGDAFALPNQPFLEAIQNGGLPATQFGLLVQDNGQSFESVVAGCNQTSAALMLDELLALGTVPSVAALRNGTGEDVALAVDQLSGSIYPSLIGAEVNHIQNNLASVRDRVTLQGRVETLEKVAWAQGYGSSTQLSRDACETIGFRQVTGGLEVGGGLRTTTGLSFYAFGHLAESQLRSREVQQSADISSYRIGGLVEYQGDSFYALAAAGTGTQEYEVQRSFSVFDGATFAESTFDGTSSFGYFEIGKMFHQQYVTLAPYLGLSASQIELEPIAEMGDPNFSLSTSAGSGDSYRSVLGLSLSQSGTTPMGIATTWLRFGWMHEFGDQFEIFQSQLATPTIDSLQDQGVDGGRNWGFVRAQVDMGGFLGGNLTVSYLGQYNSQTLMNTGLAGLYWAY